MEKTYQKTFLAGWGDMDFNSHMRNTAYLDKSADTRMVFFSEHGFPMSEFVRMKIGPVIIKDETGLFSGSQSSRRVEGNSGRDGTLGGWESVVDAERVFPAGRQAGRQGFECGELAGSVDPETRGRPPKAAGSLEVVASNE